MTLFQRSWPRFGRNTNRGQRMTTYNVQFQLSQAVGLISRTVPQVRLWGFTSFVYFNTEDGGLCFEVIRTVTQMYEGLVPHC